MIISREQKLGMLERGYLRIEGGIPEDLRDGALGAINHSTMTT